MNKKVLLTLGFITSAIPILTVASCASSTSDFNNIEMDLAQHIKTLRWKSIKDHSNVNPKDIKTESDFYNYFELENKDLEKYEYKKSKIEPSSEPGKLAVTYRISPIGYEGKIFKIFSATVGGFAGDDSSSSDDSVDNPEENNDLKFIEKIIAEATFSVEDSDKYPDKIKKEELRWDQKQNHKNVQVTFDNLKPDINAGNLGFEAKFKLNDTQKTLKVLPDDPKAIKNLLIVKPADKTIDQIWNEVGQILEPVKLIDISQREVESGWSPAELKSSFSWNKEAVLKIFEGTQWKFIEPQYGQNNYGTYSLKPVDKFKIEPTKATLEYYFAAQHKTDSSQKNTHSFYVTLDGFKAPPRGALDIAPRKLINLPEGAVSYKGKLFQRLGKPRLTSDFDRDNINQMSWSQYRLEMLFQARFLLYQEFSDDNLEEVDYYTLRDEEDGYLTVEAQGILNKDITLTHSLQFINIGPSTTNHYRNQTYKKGDVVKMRFRSRWTPYEYSSVTGAPSWKPIPRNNSGLFKFSFTDKPTEIDKTLKPMNALTLSKWNFEWYLNDGLWVSENALVYYHATSFLFYSTYEQWTRSKKETKKNLKISR